MINDCLKIIQLSDCHLLNDPRKHLKGWNTYSLLQETLHFILNNEYEIDLFLLTGDISQDGSKESYQNALQLFSDTKIPAYALPGNHDDFNNMQSVFERIIVCDKTIQLKNWRILLVDTCLADHNAGRISESELEWLQGQLQQGENIPTLIGMHHYPLSIGSLWMDQIGLQNGPAFLQLIGTFPQVKAVISGHIHQAFSQRYRHIPIMSCPSSCFQFLPNNEQFALDSVAHGYRWLELKQNDPINTGVTRIENKL